MADQTKAKSSPTEDDRDLSTDDIRSMPFLISNWREFRDLTADYLDKPQAPLPPVGDILHAFGRGALAMEANARFEAMQGLNREDASSTAQKQPLSRLASKLNSDMERLAGGSRDGTRPQEVRPQESRSLAPTIVHQTAPPPVTLGTRTVHNKEHQIIALPNNYSDGDARAILPTGHVVDADCVRYKSQLAQLYMEEEGLAQPGIKYIFNQLPANYKCTRNPRSSADRHIWLYGLPNGKRVSSAKQFFPHFYYLMKNGSSIGCNCSCC